MSQTIAQLVGADASTGFTFTSNVVLANTNSLERFRVDSSGRLLIGTPSSVAVAGSACLVQIETTETNIPYNFSVIRHAGTNAFGGGVVYLGKSRGTTIGSVTSVIDGDNLGFLAFGGANGSNFSNVAAWISGQVDGTVSGGGANDMPGRLVFSTTPDGASSPTERARITNAGDFLIGKTTTTTNGGKLQVSNGITFPATQVACTDVNTLDDYEEGTWTPTILGSSTAGAGTYSAQGGLYTKTGNTVVVQFVVSWTAHTGTGNLLIGGLPFTVTGLGSSTAWATGYATNLTITGTLLFGSVQSNTM